MSQYFILLDSNGGFPITGTTDNKKAIFLFSTQGRAEAYRNTRAMNYDVFPPLQEDFIPWLRDDCMKKGVTECIMDADPSKEQHKSVPILRFLIEIDG